MPTNKESYFMVIPASVWDTDLKPTEVLLYGHISLLSSSKGYCYASNKYFERVLGIKTTQIGRYLKELEDRNMITRKLIYKEGTKEVKERRIYMNIATLDNEGGPALVNEHRPALVNEQDTNINNTNINYTNGDDDIKGKIFFKLVERYPSNRIGNRQHNLKKFKELSIEECKNALLNLDRYLKAANGFNKSLSNYITEGCFTEAWLTEQEKVNKTKNSNIKNDTKNFDGNYEDF